MAMLTPTAEATTVVEDVDYRFMPFFEPPLARNANLGPDMAT